MIDFGRSGTSTFHERYKQLLTLQNSENPPEDTHSGALSSKKNDSVMAVFQIIFGTSQNTDMGYF